MSGFQELKEDKSNAQVAKTENGTRVVIKTMREIVETPAVQEKLSEEVKNNRDIACNRVRELLRYDPDTGVVTNRIQRGAAACGSQVSTGIDSAGYLRIGIDYSRYLLHRIIWLYWYGYMPENDIDHINGNKIDNRISNLREASHSCNMRNCKTGKNNTSGVKGVSYRSSRDAWRVFIHIEGKYYEAGEFSDKVEAVAHRLALEQCLAWNICQINSKAYQFMQNYLKENQ